MHKVSIKPLWTIRAPGGDAMSPRLIDLLAEVHESGSLSAACHRSGSSYRHAWDLVRQGEVLFGSPLLEMERGKGSRLTPLGEKLVWADRRISARLSPTLDTLASELEVELQRILSSTQSMLRIHASHGFAVEQLHGFLTRAEVPVEIKYCGSQESLASLLSGSCDVAGIHVPVGELQAQAVRHYAQWFNLRSYHLIDIATRRQGFMVQPGNPRKIYEMRDLTRPGIRFINRQPGSGTRYLLDLLLARAGIEGRQVSGYETGEFTHAAVAAHVASDMADVGFGVETPARRFKLDFIPLESERYFLLCDERSLVTPFVQQMLDVLASPEFRVSVDQLPGYDGAQAGRVSRLIDAFPELAAKPPAKRGRRPAGDEIRSAAG